MSHRLISLSPDLRQLRDEGYEVEIRGSYLLVGHVPYVTTDRTVAYGTVVSSLTLNGDVTDRPQNHEAWFVGGIPCDQHGAPLDAILNQRDPMSLGEELEAACSFSSKPADGYRDYYDKMTTYAGLLEGYAQAVDPTAAAQTYLPTPADNEDDTSFRYLDTASSRAGIGAFTERLKVAKTVIVGLGGTGSYLLDLLAKTPVREIHLYDADRLLNHNAFRTVGAASIEDLRAQVTKVEYLRRIYDPMRTGIEAHPYHVTEANVAEIQDADMVFLAIDDGAAKRPIIEALEGWDIPFIDVGIGLYRSESGLGGQVRTTTSTPDRRHHVHEGCISFADPADDLYRANIQIADLNMLNAALAVVRWKKLLGFYADLEGEHDSIYEVDGNGLINGEGRDGD